MFSLHFAFHTKLQKATKLIFYFTINTSQLSSIKSYIFCCLKSSFREELQIVCGWRLRIMYKEVMAHPLFWQTIKFRKVSEYHKHTPWDKRFYTLLALTRWNFPFACPDTLINSYNIHLIIVITFDYFLYLPIEIQMLSTKLFETDPRKETICLARHVH